MEAEKLAIASVTDSSEAITEIPATKPGKKEPPEAPESDTHGEYRVMRRNGKVTRFDASKISVALTKAFIEVEGGTAAAS